MSEIWNWSAADIAARVAGGEVSAREVAEASLARIDDVEPKLNALSEVTAEIALQSAGAVDDARQRGEALGPLAGVPITTKNNVDQEGTRNTGGLAVAKDNIAQQDSPLIANLKAAGAVVVGRSNVPAFSFRWFTDTDLHGRTYNPHDRALSPGGSSGGAAVAVATGMGALAHGNDIGGSIRQPAHMNGIFGLRPTIARVPAYVGSAGGMRAMTSQFFATDGPLARNVTDLRLGVNAMSARSALDPQQVPVPPIGRVDLPARIGVARGSGLGTPAPEVNAALDVAAKAVRDAGAEVEDIQLPRFEEAHHIWQRLMFHAIQHHYLAAIRSSGDGALIHNIDTVLEMTQPTTGEDVLDLWAQRLQIMREWSLMFAKIPVVIMPISYRHALQVDADQGDRASLEALFHDQSPLLATALLGHPGLAVPTGFTANGAPSGVQLAAQWWDEASLLAVGEVIEAASPPVTIVAPQ